jgi:ARC6-like, IMS domain
MSDTDKPNNLEKKSGFWSTLPGILSGVTALIIAITGLITALNEVGILKLFPKIQDKVSDSSDAIQKLSQDDAISIIKSWLEAKAIIFGSPYDEALARKFLTDARLDRALQAQSSLKSQNAYYKYGKSEVTLIPNTFSLDKNQASIEVIEREYVEYFKNNKLSASSESGNKTKKTFYLLKFVNKSWKISESRYIN